MEIKNRDFFAEIKLKIAEIQFDKLKISSDGKYIDANPSTHSIAEYMYDMIQSYEDANTDKKRLVREIDVILFGKGAALQASLCDLVNPIKDFKNKYDAIEAKETVLKSEITNMAEAIRVNNMVLKELYVNFGGEFNRQAKIDTEKLIKTNEIILNNLNDNKERCPDCGSTDLRNVGIGEFGVGAKVCNDCYIKNNS